MEISFTERELDIITVLWDRGPSTVAEVRAELTDDLAYNTVLTMLRVLEEKGYVGHSEEGRAFRYFPLVEKEDAGGSALGRVLRRFFGDSTEVLLTHLVQTRGLTEADARKMRAVLERAAKDQEEEP